MPLRALTLLALVALAGACSSKPLQDVDSQTGGSTGSGGSTGAGGTGTAGTTGAAGTNGGGVGDPCASTASCNAGLVCTTEDGDCKAPPGCGPNVACPAVCYGVCRAATPPAPCATDSDCKVEADYCTGCDCRALGAKQSVPACGGPGVACFVDPCFNKTARCVNGGCTASAQTETAQTVTFSLFNDSASSVWLYQGCLLELTITELSDPPRVIGRPSGCGICDCAQASCPQVACGACFQGGLEVGASKNTTYNWSTIDMTYESRDGGQCSHTRVLPAGRYRLVVPVYATQAEAAARVLPRVMTQTFTLPATDTIRVPLVP